MTEKIDNAAEIMLEQYEEMWDDQEGLRSKDDGQFYHVQICLVLQT